jgi:hypothetical protein
MLKLAPYTPIEPFEILSARYGRTPQDIIKLDANENPYGPPPEVRAALGTMSFPHIYPDPETRTLRKALGEMNGIPMEHLLVSPDSLLAWQGPIHPRTALPQVGCGADELIDLLMRCVLDSGDVIIDCPPTFTMYAFDADVNDARVVTVPRLDGFRIDVEGIRWASFHTRWQQWSMVSMHMRGLQIVRSEHVQHTPCSMRGGQVHGGPRASRTLGQPDRQRGGAGHQQHRCHSHSCATASSTPRPTARLTSVGGWYLQHEQHPGSVSFHHDPACDNDREIMTDVQQHE